MGLGCVDQKLKSNSLAIINVPITLDNLCGANDLNLINIQLKDQQGCLEVYSICTFNTTRYTHHVMCNK